MLNKFKKSMLNLLIRAIEKVENYSIENSPVLNKVQVLKTPGTDPLLFKLNINLSLSNTTDGRLGVYVNDLILTGADELSSLYISKLKGELAKNTLKMLLYAIAQHVVAMPIEAYNNIPLTDVITNSKPLRREDLN
jgi:hypothetical protein